MGNVFNFPNSKEDFLKYPPTSSLHCLVKCKFYIGKPSEILNFLLKSANKVHKTFIDKHNLRKLTQNSVIDGKEELIFSAFSGNKKFLNLIELFGAIVIYSEASWEIKCELSLKVRDFDKDEVISRAEMIDLCLAFIKSIGVMTKIPLWKYVNIKKLETECKLVAEKHPAGQITIFELKEWAINNQSVLSLLEVVKVKTKDTSRFHTQVNAIGSSFNSSFHNSFTEKNALKKLKRSKEAISELSDLLMKLKNQRKRLTVARIFQEFFKSAYFVEDANYLYSLFHFKLSTELSVDDLVDILNKRPNFRKSFLKRRNLSMHREVNLSQELAEEAEKAEKTKNIQNMDARTALKLEKVFDKYDINHDGRVDFKELKTGLKKSFDKVVIKDLFESYVRKGKSTLGLREFIEMFAPVGTQINKESLRHVQHRLSVREDLM